MAECRGTFEGLTERTAQLFYGRTEGDRILIRDTLDELNSIDYRYPIVTNNSRAVLLIYQFCRLVEPEDSALAAKCSLLIRNLVMKQNVAVEGRTLTMIIAWLLDSLKEAGKEERINLLTTLDCLLRHNAQEIHNLLPLAVIKNGILLNLLHEEAPDEVALLVVQCLEACCTPSPAIDTGHPCIQHELCTAIFYKYLQMDRNPNVEEFITVKLLISCLRGLQNIVVQNEEFTAADLGLLLGVAKSFMLYQLKGIPFLPPQKLMPSAMSVPEQAETTTGRGGEKRGGKIARARKKNGGTKQTPNGSCSKGMMLAVEEDALVVRSRTSDSEVSDTENGARGPAKITLLESRIRQSALQLLLSVYKSVGKKTMFSYWSSFIPDAAPLSTSSHSLTNCILKDPSSKGRMAALNVLLLLLSSSKVYLSQAEFSDKVGSFTPFSVTLGGIIRELHHCLCLALNDTSHHVLTQVLKCLAALVQATPYHRLPSGLVSKVVRNVKPLVHHRDVTVQVASLIVLSCTLASEFAVKEVRNALLKNVTPRDAESDSAKVEEFVDFANFDYDEDEEEIGSSVEMPWVLAKCVQSLERNAHAPVKVECLQVISAMSRNHFEQLLRNHSMDLMRALEVALQDPFLDVKLHAGRCVEFVAQAMSRHGPVPRSVTFWQCLLSGPLLGLLQNEDQATLRAIACDCLASIGANVYEELPRDKQLLCITQLFASAKDEDAGVRGAAIRALSICVLYQSLRDDVGFILDTMEAVQRGLSDESVGLREKSSWSVGNISEVLLSNETANEEISDEQVLTLIDKVVASCRDNDKIKCNAVRALGNLLQLIKAETLTGNQTCRLTTESAIAAILRVSTCGQNMKVRWNACYALGNILKNESLYSLTNWLKETFSALIEMVNTFKNFKVRINAALALAACPRRELYGVHYTVVWKSLVKALQNSENMDDFSEFKHRDHLIEQICLSLGHLATLMTCEDLLPLKDAVAESVLADQMRRTRDRLVPEKAAILLVARERILSLDVGAAPGERMEVHESLQRVFSGVEL
ncbi:PREDICTED: HEAT repeat-containing protein 6 [Nicrophorus vespilloides]|uniref:HEAT repeat-containing protein 6 n=1 Tax=Nicrophorus vespilloides TaxID=110193 RepID=A0ABM1NFG1_NICVS|nr:PREDICTED: HEAT repeat-containing protein 6 [Nicrophorus vespilloides]XP_017785561.1 PREDICTED: HEAT repeat-containing protein 6 [Nicrophorus vespilloides]